MKRGARLTWIVVTAVLFACTLASMFSWAILLTSLCADRRTTPDALHSAAYSCHGMIVYMSDLQSTLYHWLLPIGMCFLVLGLIAAAAALLAHAKVRIDVQVQVKQPPA